MPGPAAPGSDAHGLYGARLGRRPGLRRSGFAAPGSEAARTNGAPCVTAPRSEAVRTGRRPGVPAP